MSFKLRRRETRPPSVSSPPNTHHHTSTTRYAQPTFHLTCHPDHSVFKSHVTGRILRPDPSSALDLVRLDLLAVVLVRAPARTSPFSSAAR